jgi:hypothetical protein
MTNGSLSPTLGNLTVNGTTTLGTTTVPEATAGSNPVPLDQVQSLIPTLFSSVNDVTSSRALNTTYTNSTGKPIMVMVTCVEVDTSNSYLISTMYINGSDVAAAQSTGSVFVCGIVPPGASYSVNNTNNALLSTWTETY